MARLFGTDGVRGEANRDLSPELAYKLGRAGALYFGAGENPPRILIGRDTRISGPMFETALAAGIASAGGRALIAGVLPTPAIAYLARVMKMDAGIVVSASHNPFHDNGIKFFGSDGYKLPDSAEDEIELLARKAGENDGFSRPACGKIGTVACDFSLGEKYIEYVLSTVSFRLDGMRIALDCANGAAYNVMPKILSRLGAELIVLNAEPDGVNINDKCGSTNLEQLKKTVVEHGAAIGIAHDGDADRCLCVDEAGEMISGDHMLVACGLELMKEGKLAKNTIVTTVMANVGFHQALKRAGCRAEITQVGDRYVLENMREHGYSLGGEQSGHIIFADIATTGDGPVTALQVLGALVKSGGKASDLRTLMTSFPQILINVKVKSKDSWEENPAVAAAIAEGEKSLGDRGRVLVRPSGTEHLIRVMAEGPDERELSSICEKIAAVIKEELS